jgi:hypothetical protein
MSGHKKCPDICFLQTKSKRLTNGSLKINAVVRFWPEKNKLPGIAKMLFLTVFIPGRCIIFKRTYAGIIANNPDAFYRRACCIPAFSRSENRHCLNAEFSRSEKNINPYTLHDFSRSEKIT